MVSSRLVKKEKERLKMFLFIELQMKCVKGKRND